MRLLSHCCGIGCRRDGGEGCVREGVGRGLGFETMSYLQGRHIHPMI